MHRLQELVRLHRLGVSTRQMARLLRMGRNQVRKYHDALEAAGLLEGAASELPSVEALKAAMEEALPPATPRAQPSTAEPWAAEIDDALAKGAGAQAIYDTLRLEQDDFGASLWAVKRYCRRRRRAEPIRPEDVVIPVHTGAGEVAQVDFGYVGKLYDPEAGVLRRAWVFVMVLGFSRHQFCRIVFDQRTETWLRLHVEAFEYFGGVPETVVPDNLKAAVVRAAFGVKDQPAINRSYRELARHYGFKIDPTPPRAPKKKGKVESAVRYVKSNFFTPRDFRDIDEANARLDRWTLDVAGKRTHGTTGQRPLEVFDRQERDALQPLPDVRFEQVIWKEARVHPDCHVEFERLRYPVPWRFIGKQVWIQAKGPTLAVYFDDERIATHARNRRVSSKVLDAYLPEHRSALRHRSKAYWLERADLLGASAGQYIREVFDSDDVLSMLRTVQAMVTHLEGFPPERVHRACERARFFGNYKYTGLRDILRKGLDLEPLPVITPATPLKSPRYARSVSELLRLPMEETDEPN